MGLSSQPTIDRQIAIREALAKHPNALATQGGGLVIWDENSLCYVFVLTPDWGSYKVGDQMPDEWGTGPQAMVS
jgi:hypothetical protein